MPGPEFVTGTITHADSRKGCRHRPGASLKKSAAVMVQATHLSYGRSVSKAWTWPASNNAQGTITHADCCHVAQGSPPCPLNRVDVEAEQSAAVMVKRTAAGSILVCVGLGEPGRHQHFGSAGT